MEEETISLEFTAAETAFMQLFVTFPARLDPELRLAARCGKGCQFDLAIAEVEEIHRSLLSAAMEAKTKPIQVSCGLIGRRIIAQVDGEDALQENEEFSEAMESAFESTLEQLMEEGHFDNAGEATEAILGALKTCMTAPVEGLRGQPLAYAAELLGNVWDDPDPCMSLSSSLKLENLKDADVLHDMRAFLQELDQNGPAKLNTNRCLAQPFVRTMIERFRLTPDDEKALRERGKRLSEEDFPRLRFVADLAMEMELVDANGGKLALMPTGREMLADDRAGELYTAMFKAFISDFEASNCDLPELSPLSEFIGYMLFVMSYQAREWIHLEKLVDLSLTPNYHAWLFGEFDKAEAYIIVLKRIFSPLLGFGLLDCREAPSQRGAVELKLTPLFNNFIQFEIEEPPLAR